MVSSVVPLIRDATRRRLRLVSMWVALVVAAVVVVALGSVVERRRRSAERHEAAAPDRAGPDRRQPARPDGAGVRIVVNPDSGSLLSGDPTAELRAALPGAELIELTDDLDLDAALRAPGAEVLGAAGGDGTINCVAAVANDVGLPLLAAPAGTFNHLCADARIGSVDEAVEAVRAGSAVQVDIGRIDGKVFMNTATLGAYVELVDARQRYEGRIGKLPALVVALVQTLGIGEPMDLEIDGRDRRVWLLFAGNGTYQPHGMVPIGRPRLDDGLLDVRLVDGDRRWARTRLVVALLTGRLARTPVYEERRAARVDVRSHRSPLRAAIDGETCDVGSTFAIEKQPLALTLFAPPASPDT